MALHQARSRQINGLRAKIGRSGPNSCSIAGSGGKDGLTEPAHGRDRIADFADGDIIRFERVRFGYDDLDIRQDGDDTVIAYGDGDDTITLDGVKAASLDADDFEFIGVSVRGTEGDDILRGSVNGEDLVDFEGDDTLYGAAGDDHLNAQAGDDDLFGGDGNDRLYGGTDDDELYGGPGVDELHGGDGWDWLEGDAGDDLLYGGDGGDDLYGRAGNDTLYGDAGGDMLYGGRGDDKLYGGAGRDELHGGPGDDVLDDGAGGGFLYGGAGDDVFEITMSGNRRAKGGPRAARAPIISRSVRFRTARPRNSPSRTSHGARTQYPFRPAASAGTIWTLSRGSTGRLSRASRWTTTAIPSAKTRSR